MVGVPTQLGPPASFSVFARSCMRVNSLCAVPALGKPVCTLYETATVVRHEQYGYIPTHSLITLSQARLLPEAAPPAPDLSRDFVRATFETS